MKTSSLINSGHPYYASEGNFYRSGHHHVFESWSNFVAEFGEMDMDWNLVYRWDWHRDEGADGSRDRLSIYMIQQRKAVCFSATVFVTTDDEALVRKWLAPRWENMQALWAPFEATTPATEGLDSLSSTPEQEPTKPPTEMKIRVIILEKLLKKLGQHSDMLGCCRHAVLAAEVSSLKVNTYIHAGEGNVNQCTDVFVSRVESRARQYLSMVLSVEGFESEGESDAEDLVTGVVVSMLRSTPSPLIG